MSPPPPLLSSRRPSLFTVFALSAAMAACSGLGALPYLFFSKPLSDRLRGLAAAAACGVMLAVSFDLIHEGERAGRGRRSRNSDSDDDTSSGWFPTTVGIIFGALFIQAAQNWLAEHETVKWTSLGGSTRSSGSGNGESLFPFCFGFSGRRPKKLKRKKTHTLSFNSLSLNSLSLSLSFSTRSLRLLIKTGELNNGNESSSSSSGRRERGSDGGLAPSSSGPLAPSSSDPFSSSSSSTFSKNQRKNLLVVAIMAAHALGEGSGVGVSFAGERGWSRGVLTTLAIALHNVPEGLATATALASRGVSPKDALYWTLVTAAPQPLVAVPAFVFVDAFRGSALLPGALGFAAGCMVWLVAGELLPDALEAAPADSVATATVLSAAALEALRMWMALWEREDGSLAPPVSASASAMKGGGWRASSSSLPPPPPVAVVPRSPFWTRSAPSSPLTFTAALASVAAAAAAGGAGAVVADSTPAGAATLGLASGALGWASSATLFPLIVSRGSSSIPPTSSSASSHLSVLVAAALGSALVAAATSAKLGGPAAARAVSAFQESARLRRRSRTNFDADGFASHLAAPVASASAFASVSSADESSFLPTKAAQGDGNGGGNSSFFKRGGAPPPAAVAAAAGCICLAMHEAAVAWSGRGGGGRAGSGNASGLGAAAAVAFSAATRAAFVGGATATMSSLVSGRDKSSRTWAAVVIASVGPLVGLAAALLRGGGKTASAPSTLPLAFTAGTLLSAVLLLLFPVAASAAGPRVARRTATFGVFAGVVGSVGGLVVAALVGGGIGGG